MIIDIFDLIKIILLSIGVFAFGYLMYRPKIMKFAAMGMMIALGAAAIVGYYGQFISGPAFYIAGYIAADIFDKKGKIPAAKKKR